MIRAHKPRVLFICQHNSGGSQIAAAYLQKYAGEHFEVESAGLKPAETFDFRKYIKTKPVRRACQQFLKRRFVRLIQSPWLSENPFHVSPGLGVTFFFSAASCG